MIKCESDMERAKSRFEAIHREIFGWSGTAASRELEQEAKDLMDQMIDYRGNE